MQANIIRLGDSCYILAVRQMYDRKEMTLEQYAAILRRINGQGN